jgi:hypothetical protein
MLFNWWKKKSQAINAEWPQFTDSLAEPLLSASYTRLLPRLALDDARFCPKSKEDIVNAARTVN